jgi:hypothetical protein
LHYGLFQFFQLIVLEEEAIPGHGVSAPPQLDQLRNIPHFSNTSGERENGLSSPEVKAQNP